MMGPPVDYKFKEFKASGIREVYDKNKYQTSEEFEASFHKAEVMASASDAWQRELDRDRPTKPNNMFGSVGTASAFASSRSEPLDIDSEEQFPCLDNEEEGGCGAKKKSSKEKTPSGEAASPLVHNVWTSPRQPIAWSKKKPKATYEDDFPPLSS